MQDFITVRGFVATDPAVRHTASGTTVVGFRLATTERRFDREAGQWVDAHTNWFSVSAFGQLGSNTAQSVKKGNPVIVTGRLRVRDWSTQERSGTSVDVVADAVGLDLGYGASAFMRNQRAGRPADNGQAENGQAERTEGAASHAAASVQVTASQEAATFADDRTGQDGAGHGGGMHGHPQDPAFGGPLHDAFVEPDEDGLDEEDASVEEAYAAA